MADITVTQVADARPHSSEALHLLQPIASRILRLINPGEHPPIYTHTQLPPLASFVSIKFILLIFAVST